jgi:hypothetical protein
MSKKPPKHSDNAHYKHRVEVKIDIRPEATNTTGVKTYHNFQGVPAFK